jgi:hypothetical protein
MTRRSLGFLTATAALAVFGSLHLEIAAGRALDRLAPNDARLQTGTTVAAKAVNRGAKGDRSEVSSNTADARTIIFQHPDLLSTTVALRLWETASAAKSRPALKDVKDGKTPADKPKQAVACEGVVSALTEVAKQLEAGRCVT